MAEFLLQIGVTGVLLVLYKLLGFELSVVCFFGIVIKKLYDIKYDTKKERR